VGITGRVLQSLPLLRPQWYNGIQISVILYLSTTEHSQYITLRLHSTYFFYTWCAWSADTLHSVHKFLCSLVNSFGKETYAHNQIVDLLVGVWYSMHSTQVILYQPYIVQLVAILFCSHQWPGCSIDDLSTYNTVTIWLLKSIKIDK